MLEKLTPEQEAKFPAYVKKWATIGNSIVDDALYTDEIIGLIKDAVVAMYKESGKNIKPENVLISSSPIMSPFIAAAHVVGKKGKPKKPVKSKLPNMGAVEDYLNTFTNPREIINNSDKFPQLRYWCSIDAGFRAYVDFFMNETDLGKNELKKFEDINKKMANEITHLCYDMLISENFCVVSKKPIYQDLDMSGDYPVAKKGLIKWADGTQVQY